MEFISRSIADPLSVMSGVILPMVLPEIGWDFKEENGELMADIFVQYTPRIRDLKIRDEDGNPYRYLLLKMRADLSEKTNEDEFYSHVLNKFIRLLTWGTGDLDIQNVIRGVANFNWVNSTLKKEKPITFRSMMVDRGLLRPDTKIHWSDESELVNKQ